MKRIAIMFALLLCGSVHGQINVLEQGFEGRSVDDNTISRKYITPSRLIALPAELSSGVGNAEALLHPFDGQLTTSTQDLCVFDSREGRVASVLLDFGREIYGGIEIAAAIRMNNNPIRVRIRCGESVSEAMSSTDGVGPMGSATNQHTMRDYELELPWLGVREVGNTGFRFVRIDLLDQDQVLSLRSVRAVLRYRDVPYLGSFSCDNERLNMIWQTGAYTVHLNMQEYLWDGIKRDKLVWLGDMHPEVMTINSVFGQNPVVRKSLDLGRDTTPLPEWMNGIGAYSMWWVLIHRDLYLYGGDIAYLREQQVYMKSLLRLFASQIKDNRENIQGWKLLDWPTSEMPDVMHAGYQGLLVQTMEAGVQMGAWLGDEQMISECNKTLNALRQYVPPHKNNKQAASLLSLAGMIDPVEAAREVVAKGGAEGFSTFYGYYMLGALARGGCYADAMKIISDYWGAMIDLGATTFWEDLTFSDVAKASRIDELVPEDKFDIHAESGAYCYKGLRHSFCHGWASGPTAWLSQYVLGVTPLEPGCKKVRISPNLGDLQWVEGSFPTPQGVIYIRHDRTKSGKIVSKIDAPKGVKIVK